MRTKGTGCWRPRYRVEVRARREDYAIVAAVRVVTLATNTRVELELGLLTHVRRGESGLGGIGACALSGIISASWNISLVSESSSDSVTKADSLGGKTVGLGLYPSWMSVAAAFLVKAEHSPLQSSQMNRHRQIPRLPRRSPLSSRGSGRRAVGSNDGRNRARRAPVFRSLACRRNEAP